LLRWAQLPLSWAQMAATGPPFLQFPAPGSAFPELGAVYSS
ncbi:hypothetical protein A2U01_0115272, partial [Trifolium medium]|nr:hypothetical protein [Trifolium medium]